MSRGACAGAAGAAGAVWAPFRAHIETHAATLGKGCTHASGECEREVARLLVAHYDVDFLHYELSEFMFQRDELFVEKPARARAANAFDDAAEQYEKEAREYAALVERARAARLVESEAARTETCNEVERAFAGVIYRRMRATGAAQRFAAAMQRVATLRERREALLRQHAELEQEISDLLTEPPREKKRRVN